ncbi:MAG: hypothetical protein NC433_08105 [Clostridiales bacterium]|nr:hypothetical protein [Clostridiales bacterium]
MAKNQMLDFVVSIMNEEYNMEGKNVFQESLLIQYLNSKMNAVNGNSKSRRNFANIYAIYSLLVAYKEIQENSEIEYETFKGTNFTHLWSYCRAMYGGSKLQNHSFNSRVDREFVNKFGDENLIVQQNGLYKINTKYVELPSHNVSDVARKIIEKYVELIKYKDEELGRRLSELANSGEQNLKQGLRDFVSENSEARIFEISSYAILRNYYKKQSVYWGYTLDCLKKGELQLYKTGRTNANDGGIDFVMKPLGRFFQVTEVSNFDKYLLDIDKVVHYPITFVVKSNKTKEVLFSELVEYVKMKYEDEEIQNKYFEAVEALITIVDLNDYINQLNLDELKQVLKDIDIYYKLEMNEEDEDD